MVSEEMMVDSDADEDSVLVIGMVWRGWAMSRPGGVYGLILPALQMRGLLVDKIHEQHRRLYDRLRTSYERQFPAMSASTSIETSSWRTHCGHAHRSHRSIAAEKAADGKTGITTRLRSSFFIHERLRRALRSREFAENELGRGEARVVVKGQPANLKPDKIARL